MIKSRIVLGLMLMSLTGCPADQMKQGQLEKVARDWCMAVRASQVLPVYPLSEDIQPGDVFLVQTPYEDQAKTYRDKGYLRLENLIRRVPVTNYETFYANRYNISKDAQPPGVWQFPLPAGSDSNFAVAPRAAFPTYGFSVSHSEGLNVAVPVQAVPVGLNLLNSASATGTITFKDCYTYGSDIYQLETQVVSTLPQEYLKQFAHIDEKSGKPTTFLRVVNRVYLAKQVDVSLFSNQATAGSGSAGIPQPVDLLNIGENKTASQAFEAINKIINAKPAAPSSDGGGKGGAEPAPAAAEPKPVVPEKPAVPGETPAAPAIKPATPAAVDANAAGGSAPAVGGSLKVTMASSRSVSLSETFPRPLIFGYIAFDLPIKDDGTLGPPVSTWAEVEAIVNHSTPPKTGQRTVTFGEDYNSTLIRAWLKRDAANRPELTKYLESKGYRKDDIPAIENGNQFGPLRADIVSHFKISSL